MEIKCPSCDGSMEYDDLEDNEFVGSHYNAHWSGKCSCCGSRVVWTEVYTFSHVERIKIEED